MPAERVSMRKIRDALRLTHALGMSRRLAGEATGIGKTAVGEYVRRAAVAGLSWPIPDEIDDAELERRLFPPADTASCAARTEPDTTTAGFPCLVTVCGSRRAAQAPCE